MGSCGIFGQQLNGKHFRDLVVLTGIQQYKCVSSPKGILAIFTLTSHL